MQKCDFKYIEFTLLHEYSSVDMLHICRTTHFLENTSGKLLMFILLKIVVINVEVLSKQVKNYLKYISIFKKTFSNFICEFHLIAKD